jgi:hypothetical protein
MEFTDKFNEGVATVANTVKTGVDTCLLEGKILDRKKRIKKLTREIGNLAVINLDCGVEMSPEIMERYAAIKDIRAEIEEIESGKTSSNDVVCSNCGEKVADGMKFCGNCGSEVGAESEAAAEAEAETESAAATDDDTEDEDED